jgi:hypothetical protein
MSATAEMGENEGNLDATIGGDDTNFVVFVGSIGAGTAAMAPAATLAPPWEDGI